MVVIIRCKCCNSAVQVNILFPVLLVHRMLSQKQLPNVHILLEIIRKVDISVY